MSTDRDAEELLAAARHDLARGFSVRAGTRLKQAADTGNPLALAELTNALLSGRIPGGYREARRRLESCAAPQAPLRLIRARLRYAGLGEPADRDAALADIVAAAEAGDPGAVAEIALIWNEHRTGQGRRQARLWLDAAGQPGTTLAAEVAEAGAAPRDGETAAAPPGWARTAPPPQPQRLVREPAVFLFPGMVDALECAWLREHAAGALAPSRVVDSVTGTVRDNPVRTGQTACLDASVAGVFDLRLAERMILAAGLDVRCAEPLAVLRYLPGEQYKPHYDSIGSAALARDPLGAAGDRTATLLAYLNTPEAGGATAFPRLGISVAARRGDVLVFANVGPDGQPSRLALHSGEPVEEGEKWLASIWVRARPLPGL